MDKSKRTLPRIKKMTEAERDEQFVRDRAAIRGITPEQYRAEALRAKKG